MAFQTCDTLPMWSSRSIRFPLPASDCTYESPWRACYHTRSATANDLIEVKVKMPKGFSGAWHGAWCAKATPEGFCEARHDRTDSIDKRFAGNATISFVTRAPRDATAFWIVGEIRECDKSHCLWPTDYTEVEFHHIEINVEAESARADRREAVPVGRPSRSAIRSRWFIRGIRYRF